MSATLRTYYCAVCGRSNTVEVKRGQQPLYCPRPTFPCQEFAELSGRWEAAARRMFRHPDLRLEGEGDVTVKGLRMRIRNRVNAAASAVVEAARDEAESVREDLSLMPLRTVHGDAK
jgi:hypothetical protein